MRRLAAGLAIVVGLATVEAGCSATPQDDVVEAGADDTSSPSNDADLPAKDSADSSADDLGISADTAADSPSDQGSAADAVVDARDTGGSAADAVADSGLPTSYDQRVLAAGPVASWTMSALAGTEPDRAGHGHTGTYHGTPTTAHLPNGDSASGFDGATQYLSVPSSPAFSIPTTGNLTFEAWLQPAVLQFPHDDGSIDIWVNGVRWSQAAHAPTGCMSQYSVAPKAGASALNIGTMALDAWFQGAIGKVAIYDYLLGAAEIQDHYTRMTGALVAGTCSATCSF